MKKVKTSSNKKALGVEQESLNALSVALSHFETAEANLIKLERLWNEILEFVPQGISFGSSMDHQEKVHSYTVVLPHLPKIDGWSPSEVPMDLNDIGQSRLDAHEIGDAETMMSVEDNIFAPGNELEKYRMLLNRKRKELTRSSMEELIEQVDQDVIGISNELARHEAAGSIGFASDESWKSLEEHVGQVATLLGSSSKPSRWSDLLRHMRFAEPHDVKDIVNNDWPAIKKDLMDSIYDENDPIPSKIDDLSALVARKPKGSVPKELNWKTLDDRDFERLIYTLISSTEGYENPLWLTDTNAPDRGRDISVDRVIQDVLGGTLRTRVIIQCRNWQTKNISVPDVQTLQAQMKLWEPPRVDVHIIATTGRFTTDAVSLIEKDNQGDRALRVEMWPESHLEKLLAARPDLIVQFRLR